MKKFRIGQPCYDLSWTPKVDACDIITYRVYHLGNPAASPAADEIPQPAGSNKLLSLSSAPTKEGKYRIVWCRNGVPEHLEDFQVLSDTGYCVPAWVAEGIAVERLHQDRKWGGPQHDDELDEDDWDSILKDQINHFKVPFRERMLKVAAVAVAAIESADRKEGYEPV